MLVSCITSCGRCRFCKEGRYGLCTGGGGWIFGHLIDGLQAEFARVPFADTSVYKVPDELSDEQVLFLADILPTAYEVGVLNGGVEPGDTVAIVGAGPIGLAAIMTAQLHSPGRIVAIDLDASRLEKALEFGADVTINNSKEDAVARVMELTGGLGADVAIEAVGVPETFELCTDLIRPGGRVANVGVHGHSATLHLEKLWIRDVLITTGLVDTTTTPKLLKLIELGKLDPTPFATHRFALEDTEHAYDVFGAAAETPRAEGRARSRSGGRRAGRAARGAGHRVARRTRGRRRRGAVLRLREGGPEMRSARPILFATDGSPSAEEAQKEAFALAHRLDAPLVVVSVVHAAVPTVGYVGYGYADVVTELTAAEHHRVTALLALVADAAEAEGVHCSTVAVDGFVVEEICRKAGEYDAQLIVVGSHGWGATKRLLSGSVSTGLVHSAPCPVLVVRPRGKSVEHVAAA